MKSRKFATLGMALALPASMAFGQAAPGTGIMGTNHDFTNPAFTSEGGAPGTGQTPTAAKTNMAVGLCTFCHTPHKAYSTKLLWNHTLSANNFSWSDATKTTAGTNFATFSGQTYKGPTAKCLSCHDGTVAVGDVAWFYEETRIGARKLNWQKHNTGEFHIASTSGDMAGNHPVAMPYPYNQAKNVYNGVINGPSLVTTEWQPNPMATSNIRLFNDIAGDISAGPVAGRTGIECSSCHDPHNKAAIGDLFLRGHITGSSQADGYICLQCHIK